MLICVWRKRDGRVPVIGEVHGIVYLKQIAADGLRSRLRRVCYKRVE